MIKSKIIAIVAAFAMFAVAAGTSAAYMFNSNMGFGMRNNDVSELQKRMNLEVGTSLPGTTYFGSLTRTAVKSYQTMKGITPVSGYVGPLTRAALNNSTAPTTPTTGNLPAGCTSTVGYSITTGVKCDSNGSSPAQTGSVTAMLATTNPASGIIVQNQATANLAEFTFTGSGTVNSVTLKRTGFSDQNTLSNVYLYDGVTRLTDGYSFNNTGEIMMNGLNLSVNGTKTVSVKADVGNATNAPTGQTITVSLAAFTSGTSVNTVGLSANTMSVASGSTLASIAKDSTGAATGATGGNTVATASVNAGTTAYTVWRQAFQVNTRSLALKSMNLRVTGSAPSDSLANVGLYIDGIKVGNNANMVMVNGSNYLSFDMSTMPATLNTGTHTAEVRADIVKGSSYSFSVSLQQASDIMVMDTQVGVNVAMFGTLALGSFTPSTAGTISIGTGSFTAVLDPAFSSMTNTTAGASNVAIAKYKLHGYGEDIKVTSLVVTPVLTSATPAASGLQNVTLYFNGSQVGSQQTWTTGALTFSLGSQMVIPANADSTLEVRADLRTSAGTNYTAGSVSADLTSSVAEGWNSKASVSSIAKTGNILSMQTGTLALSKNAGYASQNANPNTSGVKIGSFVLQNQSSSESIRVTTLSVSIAYGAGTSSANLSALRTSETSGNAGTAVQPATAAASASGVNTFSTDFTIAPGAVKTIDILADSSSDAGATATVIPTLTVTSIGSTSNVSATSSATVGQTIAFRTGTLGTPTVTSSSSTTARLIAAANGGSADGSKAVYNFASSNASSTISELTFTVSGATTATYVKVGSVSAPVVAGTAYLTGLNLMVPNGGSGLNVDVFVSYPEVGTNGTASTITSALTLTTIKSTSGNTTTTSVVSVAAPTMTLVGQIPTFSIADSSDTLLNGSVKLAEVTVAADLLHGDIKLSQIALLVNSTGVATIASAADNILVKDTSGATIATTNATFAVAAGGSATGIVCFDTATAACASGQATANGYLIPAGTSKTFRIYATAATVSGAVNTTSLSTKLGAAASTKYYDVAGANSTAVAATLLYGYPTDTSTVSN